MKEGSANALIPRADQGLSNPMFQVVNERYLHRRPMLFITNKVAAWGRWCSMIPISPRRSSCFTRAWTQFSLGDIHDIC